MNEMNFNYAEYEENKVGLHNCRTTHIEYNDALLVFDFDEGVYLLNQEEPGLSGMAKMQCHIIDEDIDGITVYIFREDKSGKTIREDWSDNFVNAVNSGEFEFEFVSVFKSYHRILFKGYVWFDNEPYDAECEIELHTDDIIFFWENRRTAAQ